MQSPKVHLIIKIIFFAKKKLNYLKIAYEKLFMESVKYLEALGGQRVEMDYTPFFEVAKMLYGRSFVSERISGIKSFLTEGQRKLSEMISDERLLNVTRKIIASGCNKISNLNINRFV